ncbi:MAG: hypothetical protein WA957_05505, partial [Alteraurantiacibacter sp.]
PLRCAAPADCAFARCRSLVATENSAIFQDRAGHGPRLADRKGERPPAAGAACCASSEDDCAEAQS